MPPESQDFHWSFPENVNLQAKLPNGISTRQLELHLNLHQHSTYFMENYRQKSPLVRAGLEDDQGALKLKPPEPIKESGEPNFVPADTTTWEPSWSLRRFILCPEKRPNSSREEEDPKQKEESPLALFGGLHIYVHFESLLQRLFHPKTHSITWRKRPPRLASFTNSSPQVSISKPSASQPFIPNS